MFYDEFEQADTEAGEKEYLDEEYGLYLLNQLEYPAEQVFEEGRPLSETLYQGFCGEYHLIADLHRIGLEGTKPSGDFGFDVISTNFRKALYENAKQETYLYQVKTRYIENEDWVGKAGSRSVKKDFFIYSNDMLKMIMTENCYLVLYLIERDSGRIIQYIWLSNYHLDNLLLEGKLKTCEIEGKHYFIITFSFQETGSSTTAKINDLTLKDIHFNVAYYLERKINIIETTKERATYPFDWHSILNLKKSTTKINERCPKCNNLLLEREGKYGRFMGCSNFPSCTFTASIR